MRGLFGFNALYRAYLISTTISKDTMRGLFGFNALYRAYLISTTIEQLSPPIFRNVSMPFIGLISFLPKEREVGRILSKVSMPFIGLISFLQKTIKSS